jgi:hypothetical protein
VRKYSVLLVSYDVTRTLSYVNLNNLPRNVDFSQRSNQGIFKDSLCVGRELGETEGGVGPQEDAAFEVKPTRKYRGI